MAKQAAHTHQIGSAFATTIATYHRPEGFTYETMLAYDQALRRVLDQLPTSTGPLTSYCETPITAAATDTQG